MQRCVIKLAAVPMALSLAACGQFRQSAGEEPTSLSGANVIPPQFRGHWSNSLDNCDLEGGDPAQWAFIEAQSLGSYDHVYPASEVRVGVNSVEVTSQGAGRVTLRELGEERVEFTQQDGSVSIAVRCPQVKEK